MRKYLWAGYRRKSLNIGVQYSYNKNPPQFPFNFVGKGKKLKLFLCIRNSRFRKYSLDSIHGHSSCLHICRTRNVKRGFKSDLLSVNWWVLCVSRNLWRKSIWSALYSAPSPGMDVRVQCNLRENGTSTISTFHCQIFNMQEGFKLFVNTVVGPLLLNLWNKIPSLGVLAICRSGNS